MDDNQTKEEAKEKQEVEKTVDPQSNATFTKLTPGPDATQTDNVSLPNGAIVPNLNKPI